TQVLLLKKRLNSTLSSRHSVLTRLALLRKSAQSQVLASRKLRILLKALQSQSRKASARKKQRTSRSSSLLLVPKSRSSNFVSSEFLHSISFKPDGFFAEPVWLLSFLMLAFYA